MKIKSIFLAGAVALSTTLGHAWPAADSFNYGTATLGQANGGSGWSAAWRGSSALPPLAVDSTYTMVPGLTHVSAINPSGNAIANVVVGTANTDREAWREPVSDNPGFPAIDMGQDGVYYISFLYTTNNLAGWARVSLEGTGHFIRFTKFANVSQWQLVAREPAYAQPPAGNIQVTSAVDTFAIDTTYLVVCKIVAKAPIETAVTPVLSTQAVTVDSKLPIVCPSVLVDPISGQPVKYKLQVSSTNDMAAANWTDLETKDGTGGDLVFTTSDAPTAGNKKFYRVVTSTPVSDELYMTWFAPGEGLVDLNSDPVWQLSVTSGIFTESVYWDVTVTSRARAVAGHTHIIDEVRVGTTLAEVMQALPPAP